MPSARDERGHAGHVNGTPPAAEPATRAFSDREVAIVPRGEPARPDDVWTRFDAELSARRRLCAPPGMTERIMDAIRHASSA